ncbi:MAG TPA: flagellar modification protein B, partial [Sphingomicrobium sp.]|nr:flagellar modification protein B [Sphingomicrobium sp.]
GLVKISKRTGTAIVARQLAPAVYSMNASIYVWWRNTFAKGVWGGRTRLHVMPRERSIDIDSEIDFELVSLLMHRNSKNG